MLRSLLICQDGTDLIGGCLKKTLLQTTRVSCDVPMYPADDPAKAVRILTQGLSEILHNLGLQQNPQSTINTEKSEKTALSLHEENHSVQKLPVKEVRISLSANVALFREWSFPFTSRSRAEQSLNLLLETQFPCDPSSLIHRYCFTGRSVDGKGLQVISVSLPKAISEMWQKSCAVLSLPLTLLTVHFPLPSLLSNTKDTFLLLQKQQDHQMLSAIDKGVLRSVRVVQKADQQNQELQKENFSVDWNNEAFWAEMLEEAQQNLSQPAKFLLVSSKEQENLGKINGIANSLPVRILGQDIPLPSNAKSSQRTDLETLRLITLGQLSTFLPANYRRYPVFPLTKIPVHNKITGSAFHGMRKGVVSAILAATLCCSILFCLWAQGTSLFRQAEAVDSATAQLFQQSIQGNSDRANQRLKNTANQKGISSKNTAGQKKNTKSNVHQKTIPDATLKSPVRMKSILKARCADLQNTSSENVQGQTLLLLSEMHRQVPPELNVRFEILTLDDTHCHLSGTAADYESVNALRMALNGISGIKSATLLSASGQSGNPAKKPPTTAETQQHSIRFEIDMVRN